MVNEEPMQLTDIIGTTGNYQKTTFLCYFYSSWFFGTVALTMDLLAPIVTIYWDWDAQVENRTTFVSTDCDMDAIMDLNRTSSLSHIGSKLIFESQYSRRTLTEEWDLVCGKSWLVSLANFLSLIGNAFGCLLVNLSEKFGRRPLIILSVVASIVLSFCMSFPVDYFMFTVAFCLFRASAVQIALLVFIQAVEVATPSSRPYIGIILKSGVIVGQTVLVGAAWLLKDWFYTQLVQTILVALQLPLIWCILESPVWLAVRGKYEKARQAVERIVERNGLNLQETEPKIDAWLEQMKVRCESESKVEKGKVKDLFKNKMITLYTCGITFVVFCGTFIYNGLVTNAESFGSGLYVDLTASNAFSLFAVLSIIPLLKWTSVRLILRMCFLLEAFSCIVYPLVHGYPLGRTVVSVLSRFFVTPIFAVFNVYANEVFPTSVRGVGSGFISFVSFAVASPAPFTKELGEITSVYVPFILFAVLSLCTAFLYTFMPETKGRPIIHTVQELKEFTHVGKRKSPGSVVYTINKK